MDTMEAIRSRRSIRGFANIDVSDEEIEKILEAARWAPSGFNNQAWRFIVVRNVETKTAISKLTAYGPTVLNAPLIIVVFLDRDHMYNYVKDVQSIGACIQNMLLAVHEMGLGAVWLGEILKNKEKVNDILKAPGTYELMAVIALGHPGKKPGEPGRKEISELVFREEFGKEWRL